VIQDVREWLPCGVVTHDAVRHAIEEAITRWHNRWFAAPCLSVSDMVAVPEATWIDGEDDDWRIHCSAVAIRARRRALSRLADIVLDVESEGVILTDADRYVVRGLERKIIETLAAEIEQAFGLPGEVSAQRHDMLAGDGGLLVHLRDSSGRELLTVGVPTEMTLPVVKAQLEPAAPSRERLQSLGNALGSANVAMEAVVGRVQLTLVDLNNLSVGDVLVLDSFVDRPVDIASVVSRQIFARAQLSHVEDGVALVF
jgi:flagellar motor switch/type III secretory pathway protein FliN